MSYVSPIDRTKHVRKFSGIIWYVNCPYGNDLSSGLYPNEALATIKLAISKASQGDAINVATGIYDENNLEVDKDDIELWGEDGAILIDSVTGLQTLLISGDRCKIVGFHIHQSGQIGINVNGEECEINHTHTEGVTKAFEINKDGTHLINCYNINSTISGFEILSNNNILYDCTCIGSGGSTIGFYLSSFNPSFNLFVNCTSSGNTLAGYKIDEGAGYNTFRYCISGGGDGVRVDEGSKTQWSNFRGILARENHEHTYPKGYGDGTPCGPLLIDNIASDNTGSSSDQYYWGDPIVILPVNTLPFMWTFLGYNIFGNTTNIVIKASVYRINSIIIASKYTGGGDQNWDEGETVLTVTDDTEADLFKVGDLVWIVSSIYTNGEIVEITNITNNIITIARESVHSGRTGLRWNHTTDGINEKMYLIYRGSDYSMHETEICWSCASAKDFSNRLFNFAREFKSNDGLIIRALNASNDGDADFEISILYSAV